jgi:hypothetical protein
MDTDSCYKVLSDVLPKVIRPSDRETFFRSYDEWFVAPFCESHREDFIECSLEGAEWVPADCCEKARLYDSRTPGKFKEEFRGAAIVALNSKTYFCTKDEADLEREFPEPENESPKKKKKRLEKREACKFKYSSKGLKRKTNALTFKDYLSVLRDRKPHSGVNTGFVKKRNKLYTYIQVKRGLTYLYIKRKVKPDGVTTTYLDI